MKKRYGALKYVSESGRFFKTTKGNVLMFKESEQFLPDISEVVPGAREMNGTIIYDGMRIDADLFWDGIGEYYEDTCINDPEFEEKYPTLEDWANSGEGFTIIKQELEDMGLQGDDIDDFGEPYDESASPLELRSKPM